jgi:hypothetical protein
MSDNCVGCGRSFSEIPLLDGDELSICPECVSEAIWQQTPAEALATVTAYMCDGHLDKFLVGIIAVAAARLKETS